MVEKNVFQYYCKSLPILAFKQVFFVGKLSIKFSEAEMWIMALIGKMHII